jgi:peptidoglycan L-alanyl-D-glutamate endopeptidase CwlK
MKLGQHQEAFSRDIWKLLTHAFRLGYDVRMGEFERPIEMQKIYVKTGRSKTLDSNHVKKLAGDLHFMKAGVLCYPKELGDYWESLNPLNRWGGNWKSFKDGPHFERHVR